MITWLYRGIEHFQALLQYRLLQGRSENHNSGFEKQSGIAWPGEPVKEIISQGVMLQAPTQGA